MPFNSLEIKTANKYSKYFFMDSSINNPVRLCECNSLYRYIIYTKILIKNKL